LTRSASFILLYKACVDTLLIPQLAAWTIDQMQKDIGGMIEELLLPTLPNAGEKKGDEKEGGKK